MIQIPVHLQGAHRQSGLPVAHVAAIARGRGGLAPSTWKGAELETIWIPDTDCTVFDFGRYDPVRLRQCVLERRCHVCWSPANATMICMSDRVKPADGPQMLIDGASVPVVVQPWVCAPCLSFALQHCPPLRAAIASSRGLVAYVHKHRHMYNYWRREAPDDPVPPEGARVLSLITTAITDAKFFTLRDWARRFGS